MPPTESIVTTSSLLICHYWSPYLSEREVCFGGSTYWFGTLEDPVYRRVSTVRITTLSGTGSSTLLVVVMEIVEPALLADMIFQWHHEAPFTQDGKALHHSDIMDSMLADMDLPEIVNMVPLEPLSVIATPAVARASLNGGRLWPPATSHVENIVKVSEVPTSRQWASAVKPTRRVGRSGMVVDAEQQEHIIRERQRRNDMGTKYLMLESLLPPAPKVYMPFT
jgi:hypothetical protein